MAAKDFALPDLGEGLTESELVSWHVAVGDTVELNQPLAEVETAKALVELPSPFAGVITKLYAEAGTTVQVGAPIVAFELEGSEGDSAGSSDAAKPEREPVLVGYGPPIEGDGRPARRARKGTSKAPTPAPAPAPDPHLKVEVVPPPASQTSLPIERVETPRSTPPVRKLARDLGIDLATVIGTGDKGLITREDVEAAVSGGSLRDAGKAGSSGSGTRRAETGERETRTPIQGVRKYTAAAMVQSAFTAPHASEFLTIDVTPTMELIATLKESSAFRGRRLNLLTVVSKALCIAVGRNPSVNTRWDEQAQEIVQFHYVNLGIATATPRGLMVPNIKDADALDLVGLADELSALVETAKAGTASPADLAGGTVSITNIGSFGIDAGTPILNTGEAMILALGAVKRMPWEYRGEIALRQVLTLSVSFDHRLVDGEQGSRFLADVGAILANPAVLLTMV
ncbi:pyruvate dehydrogenase E2 component (dihydrolipoamide acetyltransferase) [Cryobacterium mesophilum]|uniref:Dihydrolipoamide acetyltransferase component of pyruvate dehydrogenase complex n=1 Tax=Terrimesophilobacter mesophilus TaxID=433647 RepID=A0A4R8VAJ3_9MICO|nr:dihydrolipoamide acetyltransferase family protein [Terrimesophilobacter mesophilus]MBB5632179.1 pyruvate dehydrogenase E2 component (dihydrolipoamide acetyltransferase) [Terrimesophilobacter mesophilus]TFB79042.1 2-oxo acid dehydrogenase subunit E2 [Terrimesophilobacter mesophilus]